MYHQRMILPISIILLLSLGIWLHPLQLTINKITSDTSNTHCETTIILEKNEEAIHADSLHFSCNNPEINVIHSKAYKVAVMDYLPSFQENKLLFTSSFRILITLNTTPQEEYKKQLNCLFSEHDRLFLGCLVLQKTGKNVATYCTTPIKQRYKKRAT